MSRWKHKGATDPRTQQSHDVRQELWLLIQAHGEQDVQAAVQRIARATTPRSLPEVQALEKRSTLCVVADEFVQFTQAIEANKRMCALR